MMLGYSLQEGKMKLRELVIRARKHKSSALKGCSSWQASQAYSSWLQWFCWDTATVFCDGRALPKAIIKAQRQRLEVWSEAHRVQGAMNWLLDLKQPFLASLLNVVVLCFLLNIYINNLKNMSQVLEGCSYPHGFQQIFSRFQLQRIKLLPNTVISASQGGALFTVRLWIHSPKWWVSSCHFNLIH